MKTLIALTGGLAGACVLTAIHQLVKQKDGYHAPRMDLLGMESFKKIGEKAHIPMPSGNKLYTITMISDIISNTIYYSAAGIGKKDSLLKGTVLGLAAGLGAVFLPKPLGLDPSPSNRTPQTQALAVAYYLIGGIVAGEVINNMCSKAM